MQKFRAWASKLQMTVALPAPPPRHRERPMEVGDDLAPTLHTAQNAAHPAEAVDLLAKAIRVIKHLKTRCDAAETGLREALEAQAAAADVAAHLAEAQNGRIDALERQLADLHKALQGAPAAEAAPAVQAAAEQAPLAAPPEADAHGPVILDLTVPAPRLETPSAFGNLAQRRTADADAIRQLLGWASAVLASEEAGAPLRTDEQAQPAERRLVAA